MIKSLVLLLLCACATFGQRFERYSATPPLPHAVPLGIERSGSGLFWSQVALGGASTLDVASSWGARELNPVLGQGRFGARQAAISASMTVGVVLVSNMVVRKWPRTRRMVMYATFGAAGVRGYAAGRTILQ